MEVLDKYGPVSVAIDASVSSFVSYANGYFGHKLEMCNSSRIGFSKFDNLFKLKRYILFLM